MELLFCTGMSILHHRPWLFGLGIFEPEARSRRGEQWDQDQRNESKRLWGNESKTSDVSGRATLALEAKDKSPLRATWRDTVQDVAKLSDSMLLAS